MRNRHTIKSRTLTSRDASIIKALLHSGWIQSDIASLMQCNGGRIAEISTGHKFSGTPAANLVDIENRAYLARILAQWNLRINEQLLEVL